MLSLAYPVVVLDPLSDDTSHARAHGGGSPAHYHSIAARPGQAFRLMANG